MRKLLLLLSLSLSVALIAQDNKYATTDLFKKMVLRDSLSGAKVTVVQDSAIENSMRSRNIKTQVSKSGTGPGFRIQVFSSNVQRTAKTEAFKIEKEIRNVFPELGVYVSYISPFWKVRAGDFKTSEEAQAFRSELMEAFPNLKNAMYTVKEKINF